MKALSDQRTKNMKVIQEKMKLSKKEMARFNPVRRNTYEFQLKFFWRI